MGINLLEEVYRWSVKEYHFWKSNGLTDSDIFTLIQMEDIEMINKDTCEQFCHRSELLQRGTISIKDVIIDIAKYKITERVDA